MVDRELIERCRRHEPGAFDELVERTHRQVYTLAVRLVGDRYEAEDVAQDASSSRTPSRRPAPRMLRRTTRSGMP